ncbi:gastrula zinc finger protein XlCGF91 [Gracilaria domingensis]|nr:gastrula zinc finger protein XlCGF91 [Gracilaria domingensis]
MSSDRRARKGFGIPFLLNSEGRAPSSSSQSSRPIAQSQQKSRSSFDRTRNAHRRESRPVPMQDTSPTCSIQSQSMADFRSHMSVSSRSDVASTPADDVTMSSARESSSASVRAEVVPDSAERKKPRKGDIICVKCGIRFKNVADMQKCAANLLQKILRVELTESSGSDRRTALRWKHSFRAVHEGRKRGFECPLCHKELSGPESVTRHMKNIHHNVRDVPCPHCGKHFKQGAHMRKHVETQHSDVFSRHSRTGPSSRRDSDVERSSRASSSRGFR